MAIDISANRAWPGIGWGLRERNEHGQVWRWLGHSGKSSLLAKLVLGTDYLVSVIVHTAATIDILDSLQASVGDIKLQPAGRGQQADSAECHWLMKRDIVEQCRGLVDIRFVAETLNRSNRIAFSKIVIHPW